MLNLKIIKDICKKEGVTLNHLSEKSGVSYQAIQRMMRTNSTKTDTLDKIAKALGINAIEFYAPRAEMLLNSNGILSDNFINNPEVNVLSKRFDKFSDKLAYILDIYFYDVFSNIYFDYSDYSIHLLYPFKNCSRPKYIFKRKDKSIYPMLPNSIKGLPFSKWPKEFKNGIKKNKYLMESFYFLVFYHNTFNIVDFLNDGFISDDEIIEFWKEWLIIKDEAVKVKLPVNKDGYTGKLCYFDNE